MEKRTTSKKKSKKTQKSIVPTLLQAIERVVELSRDSKMSDEFLMEAAPEITASPSVRLCCSASVWRKGRAA